MTFTTIFAAILIGIGLLINNSINSLSFETQTQFGSNFAR